MDEQLADDDLIQRHVACPRPGDDASRARLVEQGVPVWLVIEYDLGVDGDTCKVADTYGISEDAVEAARAYYRRHKDLIDARILIQTSAFTRA